MRAVFILSFLVLMAVPGVTTAQFGEIGGGGANPQLRISPAVPQPFANFTVNLGGIAGNYQVEWLVNGETVGGLQNSREIELTAGPSGEPMEVVAELIDQNGQRTEITESFTPRYLDIIIEPQTYIPSFYRGRALPSAGSMVNATAILNDIDIPTSDLVYRWEIERDIIGNSALRGQNKIQYEVPTKGYLPVLSLEVRDLSGELLAVRGITIQTQEPTIHFYNNSSLYGLLPRAIDDTYTFIEEVATLEAVPYYLDSRVYNQPDIAEWKVDRQTVSNGTSNPYQITLQNNESGTTVDMDFHVRSMDNTLQGAYEGVNIRLQ